MKNFYEFIDEKGNLYASEKSKFVTDIKKEGKDLIITYANGTKNYVPNCPCAWKKYTRIMEDQAKIGKHMLPKLQRKVLTRYCMSMITLGLTLGLFARFAFIQNNFISGQILDLIGTLFFSFVSVLLIYDAIGIKEVIDDIKKSEIFLNFEEEIKEEGLEKEKVLNQVSEYTKEKIKNMPENISIETVSEIPLQDMVQISDNIDEQLYEKSKTHILKPIKDKQVHR